MSVYDKAQELKRALMESPEVIQYKESFEKVKSNPTNWRMLEDFKEKQMELQAMQFSGQQPGKEKMDEIERLYSVISLNPDINRYLNAEYKFMVLMDDINKIISEAIGIDSENE